MIISAAVVPHPPLLLPSVTGTPQPEVEQLRAIARDAVRATIAGADHIVLVGGADTTRSWPALPSGVEAYLGGVADGKVLPLSLAVLDSLLPDGTSVERRSVAWDAAPAEAHALGAELAAGDRRTALLVAGDGSARRGLKAPGHLDERAAGFDAAVEQALACADATTLAALDAELAVALLVAGRAAWQVLAGACAADFDATLDYSDDPFGVWYAVARWARRGTQSRRDTQSISANQRSSA